jgi:hypothetical protein
MKKLKLLLLLFVLIWASCECPYQDELERAHQQKATVDEFRADVLLGTWQCYYPMIIGGMEFKQIKFMSGGKADITMAKQYDTEWYTETYNYAYYGNTLRFSRSGSNISLTIEGYLFPELYLRDSFGRYTMAKRRAEGCD